MGKEIITWIIVLGWISAMSIWFRFSVVKEADKDRLLNLEKICLSQQLNGDFAWKIDSCQKIDNKLIYFLLKD